MVCACVAIVDALSLVITLPIAPAKEVNPDIAIEIIGNIIGKAVNNRSPNDFSVSLKIEIIDFSILMLEAKEVIPRNPYKAEAPKLYYCALY